MIILFWGIPPGVFSCRPQYGVSELEFLGQIALFERSLLGAAQTPLALPYPFRTWPRSSKWAERDKREVHRFFVFWAVYARAILGSWHMQGLNEKNITENIYFQVGIVSKLVSYFVLTTLFSWPYLEAFGLWSYDCCVVAFRYRISRLNTFVRTFVVFEGGRSLPNNIMTPSVCADFSF